MKWAWVCCAGVLAGSGCSTSALPGGETAMDGGPVDLQAMAALADLNRADLSPVATPMDATVAADLSMPAPDPWLSCGSQPDVCPSGRVTAIACAHYPAEVRVDAANVFWIDWHTSSGVKRVAKEGGTPATLSTQTAGDWNSQTMRLDLDDTDVYWSLSGLIDLCCDRQGQIFRVSKSGGQTVEVATGSLVEDGGYMRPGHIYSFALDESRIYYLEDLGCRFAMNACPASARVMSVAKTGGKPVLLATRAANGSDLLSDKKYLYWNEASGIVRMDKAGGQPSLFVPDAAAKAQDDTRLYAVDKNGMLLVIAKADGTAVPLNRKVTFGVTVDQDFIYFDGVSQQGPYQIEKVHKDGTGWTALPHTSATERFAVDGDRVYFAAFSDEGWIGARCK